MLNYLIKICFDHNFCIILSRYSSNDVCDESQVCSISTRDGSSVLALGRASRAGRKAVRVRVRSILRLRIFVTGQNNSCYATDHLTLGRDTPGAGRLGPVIAGGGAGGGGAVTADTRGLGAVTTRITPGSEKQIICRKHLKLLCFRFCIINMPVVYLVITSPLLQVQVGLLPSPHLGPTLPSIDPSSPPWALAETTQAIVTITNLVSVSFFE